MLSEGTAPACPAFLSDFNDRLVPDLCGVNSPLTERKADDDVGGTLLVGASPQIELGDNGVESVYQEGGRFRFEGSSLQHAPYWHDRALQAVESLQLGMYRGRVRSQARSMGSPSPAAG
jgi:hypothetical protein